VRPPTVLLTLPDGAEVAALAMVLQTTAYGDGYRSRLAFKSSPADTMKALNALVQQAPSS